MVRIFKRINDGVTIMADNEVTRKTIKRFDEEEIDITVVTEFENGGQRLIVVILDKSDSDTFKQLVKSLPVTERNSFEWDTNDCTIQLEFDAYWAYWTYQLGECAKEARNLEELFNEAQGYGRDAEKVLQQVILKTIRKGLEG